MTNVAADQKPRRVLSARRIVLLASISGLAAGVALAGSGMEVQLPHFSTVQAAESTQHMPSFADLVAKVKPAVISVRVKSNASAKTMSFEGELPFAPDAQMQRFFRRFGMPFGNDMPDYQLQPRNAPVTGERSGFFISADGYAVTNNHVVDKASTVEITTDEGKTYSAKVIGADPRTDIALIKVDGRSDFPFVNLAESSPRVGDWVVAVGNPFGLGGTVTAGIVSARGRDIGAGPYEDFIQIDAPVNKGNSGGPTFDMEGNVIGVNTAIFSPSGGSVGIAFDIPADTAKAVIAQLKDKGLVSRGWMGVQIQPVTAEIAESLSLKGSEGALVAEPQAGSPAAKAGIESGDVVTAVNGHAVKDARDLARQIGSMAPGSEAKLSVWRKGEDKSFTLTLGELAKEPDAPATSTPDSKAGTDVPKLGLMLAPARQVAGNGSDGVVVTEVDPHGVASEHGLKAGDVILEIGGKKVSKAEEVRTAIADAHNAGKRAVLMRLKSEDATRFVAIPLGHA